MGFEFAVKTNLLNTGNLLCFSMLKSIRPFNVFFIVNMSHNGRPFVYEAFYKVMPSHAQFGVENLIWN